MFFYYYINNVKYKKRSFRVIALIIIVEQIWNCQIWNAILMKHSVLRQNKKSYVIYTSFNSVNQFMAFNSKREY